MSISIIMFKTQSLTSFIQQPETALKECLDEPIEITGGDQPYIIMTKEYLRRLLADTRLADHLDKISGKMKKDGVVPEKKIMEILNP